MKSGGPTGDFVTIFREIFKRLPSRRRRQAWMLLLYMTVSSAVGTIAAGAIALFAASFSSQEEILDTKYLAMAQGVLQSDSLYNLKGILTFLGILMVFLVTLKNLLESILFYCVARFGAAIEAHFGALLFRGFLNMPYQWHLNRNSADVILALQWRVYLGGTFFGTALKTMNDTLLVLFLLLAVVMASPYTSTVIFVVASTAAYAIYRKIHPWQDREAEKSKEYSMSINRQLTKGIHGIKDVKVSGRDSFLKDFEEDAYDLARIQGMRSFIAKIPIGLLETGGFAALASAIMFLVHSTTSPVAEATAAISFVVVAAWRILPAMSRIMSGFLAIRNFMPYIEIELGHIRDIESNAVWAPALEESPTCLNFEDEIRLKGIGFAYQNREDSVLEDVNFRIKKGQTVGIVGSSGAGKSTLVDVIIGLLEPTLGHVLVDGCALDGQSHHAWMKKLSYVPQSPYIFDGTIAGNIAFGVNTSEIDNDYVMECCRMAYMQDILDLLPEGVNTVIGERGMRLSGGQRQRTAIARALYTRPELLILDEATSSLDSRSEDAIQETIAALRGMKTLIIVAHRLQTVENCDSLVWLENRTVKMFDSPEKVLCEYEESLR